MTSEIDVSAEDLKVFLQEVDDLLDLLDEDIIRLEQEVDDPDLLQEIFRAAHTLKGSSSMVGFTQMTRLTHAMEDLLDRVRKGTLAVQPDLVDALLGSLDGLKVLRNDLAAGQEPTLAMEPLLDALKAASDAPEDQGPEQAPAASAGNLHTLMSTDPAMAARLEAAQGAGLPLLQVSAQVDPQSDWPAVRGFLVLSELDARGEVLASIPSRSDIEQERAGHSLIALVASERPAEEIQGAVATVAEVIAAEVVPWDPTDAGDGDSEEAVAEAAPTAAAASPADAADAARAAGSKIGALSATVRIDVDVLDGLMNLVGELVIDRTRVAQISRTLATRYKEDGDVRALGETSAHVVKVVDELHEDLMQVRMLPIAVLFSKFPRLVRDLARSTGKQATLEIEGGDTEIDRTVIEEIKDPLVHLIRNAVDHGVAPPEERSAAGKPETAVIRLTARHEQGHITITLSDDGQGIDPERIRETAVRKGIISAEAAARLSEVEATDLIFEPGLSTAAKATDISGRGVGLDIVRRNIENLGGRVDIMTARGEGTSFTLRIPLTLATFSGLLVESGGTVYAIPLSYVQEIVRPEAGALRAVTGRPVINLRGTVLAVRPLYEVLGDGRSGDADPNTVRNRYVVVVRAGESEDDRPVAITVDALIDQQEVVVKSLSGYLGSARGIAGASILGDGQVVLILDIPVLVKSLQGGDAVPAEAERTAS